MKKPPSDDSPTVIPLFTAEEEVRKYLSIRAKEEREIMQSLGIFDFPNRWRIFIDARYEELQKRDIAFFESRLGISISGDTYLMVNKVLKANNLRPSKLYSFFYHLVQRELPIREIWHRTIIDFLKQASIKRRGTDDQED